MVSSFVVVDEDLCNMFSKSAFRNAPTDMQAHFSKHHKVSSCGKHCRQ